MSAKGKLVSHPDLNGSEQHLPVKNQPGEKGDKDHAETDATLDADTAKTVASSDAKTQIADELRELANKE